MGQASSFPLIIKVLLFFGGLSHGLPGVLTWQTLNIWLADLGYSKTLIGLFFITGVPYSTKFLLSWIIDKYQAPFMPQHYPARRGWAVCMQLVMACHIIILGILTPSFSLVLAALLCFIISMSSALNQIATVSHRIEILEPEQSAIGVSVGIIGYRIGKLIGRAGSLYLLSFIPWFEIYPLMSIFLIITALIYHYAPLSGEEILNENRLPLSHMTISFWDVSAFIEQSFKAPLRLFKERERQWLLIFILLAVMNLGDSLILGMIDLFYIEKGFSTIDIAALTKLLGLSFAILGGATATYRLKDRTLPSVLFESCLAHSLAHISLLTLCLSGTPLKILLALTVILEHFSGGMKATLLATWIGSLCDRKKYTGSQYALFSSVKAVPFILGASCSGFLIDILSWEYFFILSFILSLPALMLLPKIGGNSVEFSKSCMQNQPMLESQ